jgi:SHS2 domain-containing protein
MNDRCYFTEFEHTGDLGIEVRAPSRIELFRTAAIALSRLMVEERGVVAREDRCLKVAAASDAELMHDLLTGLLNLFTIEGFIWSEVFVEQEKGLLKVKLRGEIFASSSHELIQEIKAVTFHELSVEQASDGWRSRIIFDV